MYRPATLLLACAVALALAACGPSTPAVRSGAVATIAPTRTAVPSATPRPAPTAAPQAPTAAAAQPSSTQELVTLTSPVKPNEDATLSVLTQPGTRCVIQVFYSTQASEAAGLESKDAGANGICSWTWHVGGNAKQGTFHITVKTGGVSQRYPFVVQ